MAFGRRPFVKVEASKFTEVGYVGRDVDSMVRDLVEVSIKLVKDEEQAKGAGARPGVGRRAPARYPAAVATAQPRRADRPLAGSSRAASERPPSAAAMATLARSCASSLRAGKLNEREVEIDVTEQQTPVVEAFGSSGLEQIGFDLSQMQNLLGGGRRKSARCASPMR